MKSTISSKGQITVPIEIRNALGLRAGTQIEFEARPGGAFLRKSLTSRREHPVDRLFGTLRLPGGVDAAITAMRGPGPQASRRRKARKASR